MTEDISGPAFPLHAPDWHQRVSEAGYTNHDFTMGMTLRDYFAAKAMQACITGMANRAESFSYAECAALAYEMANTMLKARDAEYD